ncbi:suppressor of fused domain protein [Tabrizicola sp.]|uniref:suppressor of fused domain protein n=1 Tax=Tabrizicola sp. TaxID=2005166 RepID=UPI003F3901D5
MSWWKKLLGRPSADEKKPASPEPDKSGELIIANDDPRIAEGHARMDAYWATIGKSDSDLIAYLINPQFHGAPAWPNMRQAFRIVRRADSLIIASDGLSDPFVGTDVTDASGFGMEVFIELPGQQDMSFDAIRDSAAFSLIESVARNMANMGGLGDRLDRYGVLSMDIPSNSGFGDGWTNDEGFTGILIGVPAPDREMQVALPFGPVRIVPVTIISQSELAYLVAGGAEARTELARRLAAAGTGHLSDPARATVV